jgi:hypothetical protein
VTCVRESQPATRGAHDWNRTNDLLLTKEVLYRLSYVSVNFPVVACSAMERETGIEPALVAWKATVLPLNYSRPGSFVFLNRSNVPVVPGHRANQSANQTFSIPHFAIPKSWWRQVDDSGRPALRPSGASLRLFKIAPGDFVEPSFSTRWFEPTSTRSSNLVEGGGFEPPKA